MKNKPRLAEDPVVGEVRSIRAALWREGGGTVSGLIRLIEQRKPSKRRPARAKSKRAARQKRM